jgi:guanosine-3',5'-bis(diphosphate) 3'-pyrophosphohydrolase
MKGEMLSKMILIATNAHAHQYDKQGRPYILHPLAVMNLIESTDEELQCMAVGHDLFEDTKVTKTQLKEEGFTDRVIDGIWGVTKLPGQSYEEYKQAVFSTIDRMKIKKGDLTHNSDMKRLKGISQKDIDRAAKYMIFYYEIEQRLQETKA